MKIETSELSGVALNWAVGMLVWSDRPVMAEAGCRVRVPVSPETDPKDRTLCFYYEPSTNAEQAWPIIEREGINLRAIRKPGHSMDNTWLAAYDHGNTGTMVQWVKRITWHKHYSSGPTPLIAAMRCFVASKVGDEVEVPDEIIGA